MAVDAYEEGAVARHEEKPINANPYPKDNHAWWDWRGGWHEENEDIMEAEYDDEDLDEDWDDDEDEDWDED